MSEVTISRRDFLKLGAAGLASALLGGSVPENLAAPALPERPIRPNQGVLFVMPTLKDVQEDVKVFEGAMGHRAQGLSFFADLDKKPPTETMIEKSFKSGRAVMINLQPRPTEDAEDLNDIFSPLTFLRGNHDKTLKNLAKMMAGFGNTPIFVRFAFEMNCSDWFSWCGNANGFVKMWRHTVDIFRESGALNTKWVFSPNYLPYPENIKDYYPGDDYVDVVGADIYDWEEQSPSFAVNRVNYYLRQMAPEKPLIVSELGAGGLGKDEWLTHAVYLNLSQGASAVNFFQIRKKGERDWKIENAREVPRLRRLMDSGAFLSDDAGLELINRTILKVN